MKIQILVLFFLIPSLRSLSQNWSSVGNGYGITPTGSIDNFDLISFDNKLFVGGDFNLVDNITASGVAYWDSKSWKTFLFNQFPYLYISPFFIYNNELYGMGVRSYNSEFNEIVKYNRFDNTWNSILNSELRYNHYTGSIIKGWIEKAIVFKEELYIIGFFDKIGNQEISNIAKWDGNEWKRVLDIDGNQFEILEVIDAKIYNDKLIVCGEFGNINDTHFQGVASWDGKKWRNLNGGIANPVPDTPTLFYLSCLEVYDGNLYVGSGGVKINNDEKYYSLLRWDGEEWSGLEEFSYESLWLENRVTALKSYHNNLVIAESSKGKTYFLNKNELEKIDQDLERRITKFEEYDQQLFVIGYFGYDNLPEHIAKLDYFKNKAFLNGKFDIYPNPTSGFLFLNYVISENSKTTIEIHNSSGIQVYKKVSNELEGRYSRSININFLTKGYYIISLTTKGIRDSKIFLRK